MAMARILVLDDEKLIRWSLHHVLLSDGYEVDLAETTEEAGRLTREHSYQLILADFEVCGDAVGPFLAGLGRDQAGAKVIIMTALSRDVAEGRLSGFHGFIIVEKPFVTELLRRLIKDALK